VKKKKNNFPPILARYENQEQTMVVTRVVLRIQVTAQKTAGSFMKITGCLGFLKEKAF
jgi:hypothetical protein